MNCLQKGKLKSLLMQRYDTGHGIFTLAELLADGVQELHVQQKEHNRRVWNRMNGEEQERYTERLKHTFEYSVTLANGEIYGIPKLVYDDLNSRKCVECGRIMDEDEHNYGTDEEAGNIQVCLQCYELAQDEQSTSGVPTLKQATAMFNALEKFDMPQ